MAYDRMHEALISFHSTEGGADSTPRLILGSLHDCTSSAERPPVSKEKSKA